MPQSHPTTGPVRFLSPVRFLARKAEWSTRRNFTSGPVRLNTFAYLWFGWIRRTSRVPRAMPVRASCGPRTGIFKIFHILRDPYGARAWPARVPYGTLTDTQGNWHNHNWQKSRTGVVFGRTGPVRAPHGLFTGCSQFQNPYGARKLIMHALKFYGPRTGRHNSYGAARACAGPVSGRTSFCSKQPGNSPYGARECDVTEASRARNRTGDKNRTSPWLDVTEALSTSTHFNEWRSLELDIHVRKIFWP